jgi:hypothetical protein
MPDGQLKGREDLFWLSLEGYGPKALLFLECDEAEYHGREGREEKSWLPSGN